MTLIEVVIAAVLLGVLASAVLGVILQTQTVQVGNRARIAAANLAAREIDLVRERFLSSNEAPKEIADEGVVVNSHPLNDGAIPGDPLVLDGVPYTVVRSVQWNITGDGESACEGGSLVAYPTLGVTVEVTWPDMGSIKPVVSTASLAPEKGAAVPSTSSFVAAKVTDSEARPNPGRSVRVAAAGYTRTGLTDASGCAVVEVEPAAGAGTNYTVSLGDSGYVDIGGNENPSKATGPVPRGTLNNTVSFAYDRAGEIRLRLVDPSGGPLTDADAAGAQVTLVASEYSGSSGSRVVTLGGLATTVGGLWPTQYGAFFGTAAPPSGYPVVDLVPGGSEEIEVPFELASTEIVGLPIGTTSVVAVPHDVAGTTCTTPGGRVVEPGAVQLLPGDWDFFAAGSTFGCSPGPGAVQLVPGVNDAVTWEVTTIQVTGAPAGVLWAVERSMVTGPPSTCPGGLTAVTIDIDSARGGPVALPAGDWYLYVTDGPADGACVSFPAAYNPRALAYGQANIVAWPAAAPVTVTVTGVPSTGSTRATILASTSPTMTCNQNTYTSPGTVQNLGSRSSVTTVLGQGTWYIFGWDTRSSSAWNPRCRHAGTVIVGWNSPLSLAYNSSNPGTVGP